MQKTFYTKKTYTGPSKIHGIGIIARKDIKKGEIVFIIKGKLVTWQVKDLKSALHGANWVGVSKNVWIDPSYPTIYLNHSCNPTCGITGRFLVTALKDLKKGEEITIDYSITESEKLWKMNCDCGSKNCRKVIRSVQFLPQKTYDMYHPYIPTYIQKVYNESHERGVYDK